MKTVERILGERDVFVVDEMACMQHAQLLKSFVRIHNSGLWNSQPKDIQFLFKVSFISICHQFNWDFLQNALARYLLESPNNIADTLISTKSTDMQRILADYSKPERIRGKERAALLRNVGVTINDKFNSDVELFYKTAAACSIKDGGFKILMDNFKSFSQDPLRKKTNVLLHDVVSEKIVRFKDEDFIEPAVDYHIMRLYLRTGRVIPSDISLFKYLKGAPNPRGTLVRSLRKTVSEAEKLTALYANLSVPDVNYIEWQIGRSICHNDQPNCFDMFALRECPSDMKSLGDSGCPYKGVCSAVKENPTFIDFEEPKYISSDY